MNTEPQVSIVTAYYNRAAHVRESIQSLLDQTLKDIEIIAVDDGSTDGTAEVLQSLSDPRLRVIVQKNAGFTVSINRVIRTSRAPYIAIHGSGDLSFPRRIEAQAAVLDAKPEVGVVGCYVRNQDAFDPARFDLFKSKNGLDFFRALTTANLFTHGEVMFRRCLYDQVGGYREFFRFAQDRDMWLRMSRLTDYYIVEEPLYQRFKLEDGVSTSVDKLILQGLLSEFAVQCAVSRGADGRDLLDRYGELAPLLRRRSAALSVRYRGFGRDMLFAGKGKDARRMIDVALEEGSSFKLQVWDGMLRIYERSPWVWNSILRPMLEWMQSLRR